MFRLERFLSTSVLVLSASTLLLIPAYAVELHVAGLGGAFYFDGDDWIETSTDSFPVLYDLWGLSSDDMFGAGSSFDYEDGVIYHYDGQEWTMAASFPSFELFGIWGSSGSDIFAAGYHDHPPDQNWGRICHYDGIGWSAILETPSLLYTVWGIGPEDVFAGGVNGCVMHYDGMQWTQIRSDQCEPTPGWSCGEIITGIWGEIGEDIYACGYERKVQDGSHGGNVAWDPFVQRCFGRYYWAEKVYLPETLDAYNVGCEDIWGASGTDIFIGGHDNHYGWPIVYHYDGLGWTIMENGEGEDIWGVSGSEVYTVFANSAFLYDGSSWTEMPTGNTGGPLLAIWGDTTSSTTGTETPGPVLALEQNFPNPFNPATTIRFSLPSEQHVTIRVYDVSGAHMTTLVDGIRTTGTHFVHWDGHNSEGRAVPSGVYFCRLTAGNLELNRKMVMLR